MKQAEVVISLRVTALMLERSFASVVKKASRIGLN